MRLRRTQLHRPRRASTAAGEQVFWPRAAELPDSLELAAGPEYAEVPATYTSLSGIEPV